jgi:hypothetical protein
MKPTDGPGDQPRPTCRAVKLPSGDACGELATHKVVFSDDDKTIACQACALNLRELIGSSIKVEKLNVDEV